MIDEQLINWLDSHVNYEKEKPSRRLERPTLERMQTLCKYLGDPQASVPSIHITGTNGKTSTSRIASSLLTTKGLYTGLIDSPHLIKMNERIMQNLFPISEETLEAILRQIKLTEEAYEEIQKDLPSWFEIMIAAGFMFMNEEAVDVGVIEVGMGGLYDATNVCESEVSVITNVQLDHMAYLGSTREKIAKEKSGIIKAGNNVVIGEEDSEIISIFADAAQQVQARCFIVGEDFELISNVQAVGGRLISFRTPYARYEDIFVSLLGYHQGINSLVATVAAEAFIDDALGEDVVAEAMGSVRSPGRMEILHRGPLVVADGAHNIAGAQTFARALDDEFTRSRRIYLLGLTSDKSPTDMINALNIDNDDVLIAVQADSPKSMEAEQISKAGKECGIETVLEFDSIDRALENAMSLALDDDHIIVTGSLYVVGTVREILV